VDTVGSPSSTTEALQRVEGGGSILCLGLDDQRLDITSQSLVRSQISLQGSLTYDHPDDFASTISLVASGRLAPGRIVTDEYPLEETQIAFERSGSARGKTWISIASPN
jgi:threonine dehydrogenase-like Zn-dependent dehydrogenase